MDPEFLPSLSSSRKSHKISNIFIIMSTCRLVEALGSGVKYYMTVEWRRWVGQGPKSSWFQLLCSSLFKRNLHSIVSNYWTALLTLLNITSIKCASMPVCQYASMQVSSIHTMHGIELLTWHSCSKLDLLSTLWTVVQMVKAEQHKVDVQIFELLMFIF